MKKTLQDQYLLIKEGKGHKGVFLADAKRDFPHIVPNSATFEEAAASLKTKNIISENVVGLSVTAGYEPRKKESYETAFESFLSEAKKKKDEDEKVKAEEKKVSKHVEEDLEKQYDKTDDKNPDNLIFDQIMMGYYAEMKDPKNANKTMQELKDMVFKNLAKDPIHYTKDGQFGIKGLGYETEHPGLGTPKEPKGKYASSGYGNINESKELNVGDTVKYRGTKVTVEKKDEVGNLVLKTENGKTIRANKAQFKEYGSLEEEKLRKAIREMIDAELEEAYQMFNVNPSAGGGGEGGRRFIPTQLPFPQNIRKRFGDHIVYNPSSKTLYISQILYNNLVKGYANQPAIKKLIMDIPPMVKQILNKPDNYGSLTELPKEFQTYLPLNAEVEKAKADKFNKAGDKQYWSEGDFLIPNLNVMEEGEEMEPLKESVEKDLAAINKEAEHEILQSKLDKIAALIDKKQSQLGKLDEDEDMKALTDAKKVKEIQKDIKALEKAKSKVEKMMGKHKGKKKEVIDEIDAEETAPSEELDQDTVNGITEKYNEIWEKNGIVTDKDIQHIANQYPFVAKSVIVDYLTGYGSETEYDL